MRGTQPAEKANRLIWIERQHGRRALRRLPVFGLPSLRARGYKPGFPGKMHKSHSAANPSKILKRIDRMSEFIVDTIGTSYYNLTIHQVQCTAKRRIVWRLIRYAKNHPIRHADHTERVLMPLSRGNAMSIERGSGNEKNTLPGGRTAHAGGV
ncbi:MAG TPA: hypothetical protein PKE04_11450 [Clostridia bacterium]|nr:hypothetical protein [Clostridia bacterium]